jgi:hypothetical protein
VLGRGLQLSVVVTPRFDAPATKEISAHLVDGETPPAKLPGKLTREMPADGLIGANDLPTTAPLAHLLPLLLRLKLASEKGQANLSMLAPLQGPRWLVRPHIDPAATSVPLSGTDLAAGIRVLVDVERRRSLALIAASSADPGLLRDAEVADAVLLSDAIDLSGMSGLDQAWMPFWI